MSPSAPPRCSTGSGEVSHLDVADMHAAGRRARTAPVGGRSRDGARTATVRRPRNGAVSADRRRRDRCAARSLRCAGGVAAPGSPRCTGELGVHTIDGGPTLNPSTYELLAGIHEVPAEEVVVLPGSANVVMAAERAAELSDKQVLVVPRHQPAGGSGRRDRASRRRER